ncbi:MAG: ribosome-binding factor A [Opitutae bacterium]|jgi:ribosome-binding factor A|nr:ribosome-binding factor A [Opitutae bacterium]
MSKRISRVNELLQREIGEQLRRYYGGAESVKITISDVDTSPDLRQCKIFYAVMGEEKEIKLAQAFFKRIGKELRQRVMARVTLKYFPRFDYMYDPSMERGAGILDLLDQLDNENEKS